MWYLGVGSIRQLPESSKSLITDLSRCLSKSGFSLRTGGRGEVDDAFWHGAGGGIRQMILPIRHFRHYESMISPEIISYDKLPSDIQSAAIRECALPASRRKYHSKLKRAMDDVCVPLVMGANMKAPVRFAITYAPGPLHTPESINEIGTSDDPIYLTPDAAAFYLLKKMRIPVFNLTNEEHVSRIINYINTSKKTAV